MKLFSKSLILLFSEAIWVYYVIAMFASIEMNKPVFVNVTWWCIAAIVGYLFNALLAGKIHYVILLSGNVLFLGGIVFQNIKAINEGAWLLTVVLSVAVIFVFVRSASFVFREREPNRLQMLQHFEANMIAYAILALIFSTNGWSSEWFHGVFLLAISFTLIGMILTLQNLDQRVEDDEIEVKSVGHSGWFTGVMSGLLLAVALICTLLFLPSIRQALQTVGVSGFQLLKGLGKTVLAWLTWFFGLFTPAETEGPLPEMAPPEAMGAEEVGEELLFSMPIEWFITIIAIVVGIVLLVVFSKFLKGWQPPKPKKRERILSSRTPWWHALKKLIMTVMTRFTMIWRSSFPRYYKQPIYWYFTQVQKWGEKNGITRGKSETSGEYVEKLIRILVAEGNGNDTGPHPEQLQTLLREMNAQYEAAYYGGRQAHGTDYHELLKQLSKFQLPKKRRLSNE